MVVRIHWFWLAAVVAFALATPMARAASASKGVVKVHIDGVDDVQRAAAFKALDIGRYRTRKTIAPARAERLAAAGSAQIAATLENFGYYSVTVTTQATRDGERWDVRYTVVLGEPVTVTTSTVRIVGPAAANRQLKRAIKTFAPKVGDIFDHAQYEESKGRIERGLARLGYFETRSVARRVEVQRKNRSASIDLQWESGPRYRFGELRFEGSQIDDEVLQRFVAFKPGEAYNQGKLVELQQRLSGSDYFALVSVVPDVDAAVEHRVPITITLTPAARTAYTAGVSFDADVGAGVRLGVDRRWVNRHGDTLRTEGEFAQRRKGVTLEYRIPRQRGPESFYTVGLRYRDEDTDAVRSQSYLLKGSAIEPWREGTLIASLNLLQSTYVFAETRSDPPMPLRRTRQVLFPELDWSRVFARDRIHPREGASVRFTARGAATGVVAKVGFLQAHAEGRYIRGLGDASRMLFRAELGTTAVSDLLELPPELRFYAGGDRSVRGYAYQGIGGRSADDTPTGGKHVVALSAEFERTFKRQFAWAAFVDAGDAFDAERPDLKLGAGVGLRWNSPVGPVRIDIAHGFDGSADRSIEVYLSAGPDL